MFSAMYQVASPHWALKKNSDSGSNPSLPTPLLKSVDSVKSEVDLELLLHVFCTSQLVNSISLAFK